MIKLNYIKKSLMVYLGTGIFFSMILFTYSITDSYNKNLVKLKDNLQRAIIKKAVIKRDLSVYKANLAQLRAFTGGSTSAERSILERIDTLRRLYPKISISPSKFMKNNGVTELTTDISFRSRSYLKVLQFIKNLMAESMPVYQFSIITIRPVSIKTGGEIECRITGKFIYAGVRDG